MNQIERKNELLEAYVMYTGFAKLWECVVEARRALGVKLDMDKIIAIPDSIASLCVLGAWMKRVRCN